MNGRDAKYRLALGTLAAAAVMAPAVMAPAVAWAAPPSNDDFTNARSLSASFGTVTGTNAEATDQAAAGEPDHAGSGYGPAHSVWYRWTAAATLVSEIDTCGSTFDTRLAVYTASTNPASFGSLVEFASNDDATASTSSSCAGSKASGVRELFHAGTEYFIAVDTSGELNSTCGTRGPFQLRFNGSTTVTQLDCGTATPTPPGDEDPDPDPAEPTDDGTNPGVAVSEAPYSFEMPRLKPRCKGVKGGENCSAKSKRLKFRSLESARGVVESLRADGADLNLVENPKASSGFAEDKLKPGSVLQQSIPPGETVVTTGSAPRTLELDYYQPAAKAKSWLETLADALNKALDEAKKKSKCKYIAYEDKRSKIIEELNDELPSPYLTEALAAKLLKKAGCKYRVTEYFDAPGIRSDFVDEVTTINPFKDEIGLRIGLPVSQDFLLTFREDPTKTDVDKNTPDGDTLALGTDGALTSSPIRSNVLTVQVIERQTGRLVEGAAVSFIGENGRETTQRTDGTGETTFSSRLVNAGSYAVEAQFEDATGATMRGFREIRVRNRKGEPFTTMTGRTLTYLKRAEHYQGTQAELDRARSLAVVPATIGTGLSGEPASAPTIQQGTVLVPTSDGRLVAGQHNVMAIPDDSSYAIGAAPGLVAFGGGIEGSFGRRAAGAHRQFPNPFAAIGNFVSGIVTGLTRAFERGTGTVAQRTTPADQQKIAATADRLAQNGVAPPAGGLISDKGLGVISTGGGNVISTGGGNVISTGGLNLIGDHGTGLIGQAGGNLIGQAGGNLIGQAGGNVISTGGLNLVPVYGGRIISDNGAS